MRGTTPLHIACIKDYIEIVRILLENGTKHNEKTENGWTPLHFAVLGGGLETVKLIISKGSDINSTTTPFYLFYSFI